MIEVEVAEDWERSEVFSSKAELVEYLLLVYLSKSKEPVGSWALKVMLEVKHIEVSTATIGRLLKSLDSKKYTRLLGTSGRMITPEGIRYANELSERLMRERLQRRLMEAAQPQNIDELIDLLVARKAIECETARLAAGRADEADIETLRHSMDKHEETVRRSTDPTAAAFDFHEKVARISRNRFLIAALDVLIYEELRLEAHFPTLITRERGGEYLEQHRAIAAAIKNGDEETSHRLMGLHIDTLIEAIREQGRQTQE